MTAHTSPPLGFEDFGLSEAQLHTLQDLNHETPTPIQMRTIPALLKGDDVVGQAQTGTGKTAAFALPLISRIDPEERRPQVLVLTPTRELAIQVADAISCYARGSGDVNVLPIFGGQDYAIQIRGLKRGAQVVVGTPGRVMDHMRRKTLDLSGLRAVVLDEADEMLRMGFEEDVEWVMERTPENRQVALFSATMPPKIRRIAKKYLNTPLEVSLEKGSRGATTINQYYCTVPQHYKLEVLTRILESEETDGIIIFARTKVDTVSLADSLVRAGFRAAPLNGDLAQSQRERTVGRLKDGIHNILVATDVAARGLDVERISHVINYDAPRDVESYVHRIGRTGRAGRTGKAILLLSPRDRQTLRNVEQATKQKIEQMPVPSAKALNEARIQRFSEKIADTTKDESIDVYRDIVANVINTLSECSPLDVAAALAAMLQGDRPLLLDELPTKEWSRRPKRMVGSNRKSPTRNRNSSQGGGRRAGDENMERYRVQVGASHGMNPSHLVGAIANEAALSSKHIGRIEIYSGHSTVDLPIGMPLETFEILKNVRVCNRPLRIRKDESSEKRTPRKLRQKGSKKARRSMARVKRASHKKKTRQAASLAAS